LSGRPPLFPCGSSVATSWRGDVGPVLQSLFTINSALTPHWVRRENSVDLEACSDSFRLCYCLYRRAAYFVSPALLLWWLLARGHASTQLSCSRLGISPADCRLSLKMFQPV
jgi:hypothetical protein